MPVTKTAKRALRSSKRKETVNKLIASQLEVGIRVAKREKAGKAVKAAIALADRAAKKKLIHKNKAARIKSRLDSILKKESKKTKS